MRNHSPSAVVHTFISTSLISLHNPHRRRKPASLTRYISLFPYIYYIYIYVYILFMAYTY